MRLYCFPPAGGSRASFRRWPRLALDSLEIIPVEPPGRNFDRECEAFRILDPLLDHLEAALGPELDSAPFAFYGLSMGSLVAFELARRRAAAGLRPPRWLFVAGHRAPHLPRRFGPWHDLPDEVLIHEIRELGGIPEVLLDRPRLVAPLLETVRADAEVTERYQHRSTAPLACPVTAFLGLHDPMVTRAEMAAWQEHSDTDFELIPLSCGHFPDGAEEETVVATIVDRLLGHAEDRLLS